MKQNIVMMYLLPKYYSAVKIRLVTSLEALKCHVSIYFTINNQFIFIFILNVWTNLIPSTELKNRVLVTSNKGQQGHILRLKQYLTLPS